MKVQNYPNQFLFCDTEQWCHKVLKKNFPGVPIFNDVKEIANDPKDLFQKDQISSPLDIRVNHFQSREIAEGKKTLATSSRTSLELLNKQDPLMSFTKMFMDISRWDWTRFSLKWKASTTVRGHLYFRLHQSEHGTKGTDSGSSVNLYATPNTMDHLPLKECRSNEENARRSQKGTEETEQSERAVRSNDNEFVSNSNDQRFRSCLRGTNNDLQKESGEWRDDGSRSSSNDGRSDAKTTKNENLELSDTTCERLEGRIIQSNMEREQRQIVTERSVEEQLSWWEVERQLHGVPNGISTELDKDRKQRLIGLGNAICPQNAMYLGLALRGEFNGTS